MAIWPQQGGPCYGFLRKNGTANEIMIGLAESWSLDTREYKISYYISCFRPCCRFRLGPSVATIVSI